MKRILILVVAISFLLCSTASAFQGGGGEKTKNPNPSAKPRLKSAPKPKVEAPKRSSTPTNISGLKIGKDKSVSEETSTFGSNDKVYGIATVSNAPGKVKVKGRLVVVGVPGHPAGPVPGLEKTLELDGSGTAIYTFTPPADGWPKGKYKLEVIMMNEVGVPKDTKSASFTVEVTPRERQYEAIRLAGVAERTRVERGIAGQWFGAFGPNPDAQLIITNDRTAINGVLLSQGVRETLRGELLTDNKLMLTPISVTRISGTGNYSPDTILIELGPDGSSLKGSYRDTSNHTGSVAMTRRSAQPNPETEATEPELAFAGRETFQSGGRSFTRYKFTVTNRNTYPQDMFASAPDLPPCGRNTNASRTWVDLYDVSGKRLYGFCAFGKPDDLGGIWFALEEGVNPPSEVFVVLSDRLLKKEYKSNLATIP